MNKSEVVLVLREMADVLEVADAKPFEIMAYRNGSQALEDWTGNLEEAVVSESLTAIPAIGKGLARMIADLVASGTSAEVQRVRQLVPEGLPTLLKVRGLGPKRVRTLWKELEVESPSDLRRAAAEGRIQALKGFGQKTVDRIVSGLDYLERPDDRPAATASPKLRLARAPQSTGRLYIGSSGFSYSQWRGTFYPEDASSDDLLRHYAERLPTVEINNTFYRFPSESVIQQWLNQTPESFHFSIKAHQRITHRLRLSESASDQIVQFVHRCGQLGERLACVLFQLPPNFARDTARLDNLLSCLPDGPRYAIEFRHESWFDDVVERRLAENNIATVLSDSEDSEATARFTADFVYARLRRSTYSDRDLEDWNARFDQFSSDQRDVLAYFKHDDNGNGPKKLAERWGAESRSS